MKANSPQPRNPVNVPPMSEEDVGHGGIELGRLWREFKQNRLLQWVAAVAVILLAGVPAAVAITNHLEDQKNSEAWHLLSKTLQGVPAGADPASTARDVIAQITAIRP